MEVTWVVWIVFLGGGIRTFLSSSCQRSPYVPLPNTPSLAPSSGPFPSNHPPLLPTFIVVAISSLLYLLLVSVVFAEGCIVVVGSLFPQTVLQVPWFWQAV